MAGTCSCKSCCLGGLREGWARPQTPQTLPTLPQASKATTLTATCPCHLFFRGFKGRANGSLEPPEKQMAGACSCKSCCLGGLRKGLGVWGRANGSLEPPEKQMAGACSCKSCCLGGLRKGWKRLGGLDCRLPALKPPKPFRRPPRQQLLQLHAPAICFSGVQRAGKRQSWTPWKTDGRGM